jgi:hypothetical protein
MKKAVLYDTQKAAAERRKVLAQIPEASSDPVYMEIVRKIMRRSGIAPLDEDQTLKSDIRRSTL